VAVTFDNIVQRVKQQLLGYTRDQAAISFLVQPMTATSTTFMVDPGTATNLSSGLTEIGDEMILVKNYDRTTGTVNVMAGLNGRGAEGTVAASHATNDIVTADPRYPRVRIKEAINDTIVAMYPDLFIFGQYEFPYLAARYEYPIPAEVDNIYKVTANTVGPSGVWKPITKWRFNTMASTTPGQVKPTPTPTGKTIQLFDQVTPGRNIRVSYTRAPSVLSGGGDDFATVTGYPERYIDMVTYGACWRMLPSYEAGRLQQQSIEATERAPLVPVGAATNASQYFLGLYTKRMNEERDRLLRLFESYQNFNA
jgi:hypothetical protein